MTMAIVWTLFVTASLVCGAVYGTLADVTAAAMEGASAAVELTLSMAGALCLWSGVMTVLGLGNAATPLGIRAAQRMAVGCGGTASDELCRLVVLNTASIQLLPTTVAAVRSAQGCTAPLDILPAVWLSSVLSVSAGLLTARLLQRVWRR